MIETPEEMAAIEARMAIDEPFAEGFRAAIDAGYYDLNRNDEIRQQVCREMVLKDIEHYLDEMWDTAKYIPRRFGRWQRCLAVIEMRGQLSRMRDRWGYDR